MTQSSDPGTPTWRTLAGHILVGVPWGVAWTVVVGGGLAAAAAFPIGLPVAAATLLLVPLGAELERDRAVSLLGHRPDRPEPRPLGTPLARVLHHARSHTTWREAFHLATFGPLAILELMVLMSWAMATTAALTAGWWLPAGPFAVGPLTVSRALLSTLLACNGAAGLLAGPAVTRAVGALHRGHLQRLLGGTERDWQARATEAERRRELLAQAASAERERIERDLHDGLQPLLVTAAVTIAGARRSLPSDPEQAQQELEDAQALLRVAMGDVRALVQGLAPRSLRESGLDAALGELAAGTQVPTELEVELREPVDDEAATTAYFVTSEAVANAVRHSGATTITIRVTAEHGHIAVLVSDDGIGGAAPRPGRGLGGLDARTRAVGGELRVLSPPGAGTVVRAHLPNRAVR
jgi:signal transduction histidine kinase